MQIEVKHRVSGYVTVEGDYKRVEVDEELTFATWDDFQNWQGYTVEALGGDSLDIKVKMTKEA